MERISPSVCGVLALTCALTFAPACGLAAPGATLAQAAPDACAEASLCARLGGVAGVKAIAATLIDRVAADPRLGRSFQDADLERIKRLLGEQLCELADGPCRYSGDSMKEVHAGHHISQAEFYGMVTTLRAILKERHVGMRATNELLKRLAPMKRDVVESATRPRHAAIAAPTTATTAPIDPATPTAP
jgi:hemoglobin